MLVSVEQQLFMYMRLPWTLTTEWNDEGGYFVTHCAELPSVIATGDTEKDLSRDLWESLEATLRCYLEHGDPIPLPAGVRLTLGWEREIRQGVTAAG